MISCGNGDKYMTKIDFYNYVRTHRPVVPPPIYKYTVKHDTVRVDTKHMTTEQYKQYLEQVYKAGIDSLISPQFKSIAKSNQVVTSLIKRMFNQDVELRKRTRKYKDSIANKNDSTEVVAKRRIDSATKVANDRQTEILKLNQQAAKDNAATAEVSWDIVKILLALTVVIIATLIIVYRRVSKLGKKVEALEKTLLTNE
jgi:hypothetical protein